MGALSRCRAARSGWEGCGHAPPPTISAWVDALWRHDKPDRASRGITSGVGGRERRYRGHESVLEVYESGTQIAMIERELYLLEGMATPQ